MSIRHTPRRPIPNIPGVCYFWTSASNHDEENISIIGIGQYMQPLEYQNQVMINCIHDFFLPENLSKYGARNQSFFKNQLAALFDHLSLHNVNQFMDILDLF